MGRLLAEQNIELVYGGGRVGLMGLIADACLANGGKVLGVIPQFLVDREAAHTGVTELITVGTMHQRKQVMCDRSDAAVALAGGTGTLDELFELFTWRSLGIHSKPIAVLNTAGFYDPLLLHMRKMVDEGFVSPEKANDLLVETQTGALLERLKQLA